MDSAAAGEKPAAGADNVNDMKTILESIQSVDECGMGEGGMPMDMPSEPEDKMSMNVSLNARGDAVEDLIKLMGGAIAPQDAPVSMPMPMPSAGPDTHDHEMGDMKKMMKLASDADMEAPAEDEPEMEDWDNSPEEEYSDTKTMTKDLSGGINREKKAYAKAQDGDNAMAVETSIKEQLWAALNDKLAEGDEIKERGSDKKLKASRGKNLMASRGKTTEGSRGKASRGKKSRG